MKLTRKELSESLFNELDKITDLINKIGDLSELITEDKSTLVKAINEVKASAGQSMAKIYGIRIDKTNSNPETSVTYTDDAINMESGSSAWDNVFPFNQIKPCVFKDGSVNYYLHPNDFTKKADGSNADITSGNDGDVMIEFPKVYWKITSDISRINVKYATRQIDSTWKSLAHTKGAAEKDKIYIGSYLGNAVSSKLRSLSNKLPTVSQTIGICRSQAQANGTGYQQMGYYQLLMLQVLYLVRYKSLDSQTALGRGYVENDYPAISTGGTNTKGMYFGETTGKQQMKFCGIEDFWGNCHYWIDGFFYDSNRNVLIGNQDFNDTGNGYQNFGQFLTYNLSGYVTDTHGNTETGFIIKSGNGSTTTYYCDYCSLISNCLPYFGGGWDTESDSGVFMMEAYSSASSSYWHTSSRLCYV